MADKTYWLRKFREIEHISAHGYTVQTGDVNFVFLGSCRMVMLCVYLMEYLKFDTSKTFGISIITDYHYKLLNRFGSPMQPEIKVIIENADFIIHEPTKQMEYLNTSLKTDVNIYNTFNLKPSYMNIKIPHVAYLNSIFEYRNFKHKGIARAELIENGYPIDDTELLSVDEIKSLRSIELKKLIKFVREYEFFQLADLLETQINTKRLFATFSHPMPICFIYLMRDLIPKLFKVQLDSNIENHLRPIDSMILLGVGEFTPEDRAMGILV